MEFFDGVVDEVRIWEVERSPDQIHQTMHVLLTGSEHGLVGYWNFDECAGARLRDKLGRHDGVRRGGRFVQSSVQLRSYQSTFGCVDALC